MKYSFSLKANKKSQVKTQNLLKLLKSHLGSFKSIDNEKEYNLLLASIINLIKQNKSDSQKSPLLEKEIGPIQNSKPLTEKTPWGGVALKKVDVEKDYIRKLLVIKQFGILGFEIHKYKVEKLRVLEGECLFIYSNHKAKVWKSGNVFIKHVIPGDRLVLLPGDEHGMIALTDCIVEETSTNHLDDLIFLFNSEQVI